MLQSKGIVFAADIIEKEVLLDTIMKIDPFIEAIKIGNVVLYQYGWDIIKYIKKYSNKPIIADLKLMDIPYIAEQLTKSAIDHGADAVIVCGIAGSDTIDVCRRNSKDKMLFVFTEFTHCSAEIKKELADDFIETAMILDCDGIQVPATKKDRIRSVREMVGPDMIIITCGIGSQISCSSGENIKIGSAIASGANYEIIGRAIYNSESPIDAARKAKESILSG
ncbi:MAG: orotidine-5'-phosphate decarboxylase [Candidatus Magnetominusculus sp. LBB02]|nr:orotidine-5'-phosphate decarboxylase [Candidatus Magnetominusculus sp. LBB02]